MVFVFFLIKNAFYLWTCFVFYSLLFFFFKIYLLLYISTFQKRALDLIMGGCEPPCSCWDLNSGPSEEQSVLLPAEPSHQPYWCYFCLLGIVFLFFIFCLVFQDRSSLCSPGCLGNHFLLVML